MSRIAEKVNQSVSDMRHTSSFRKAMGFLPSGGSNEIKSPLECWNPGDDVDAPRARGLVRSDGVLCHLLIESLLFSKYSNSKKSQSEQRANAENEWLLFTFLTRLSFGNGGILSTFLGRGRNLWGLGGT